MGVGKDHLHLVEGEAEVLLLVDRELSDREVVSARELLYLREKLKPFRALTFFYSFLVKQIVLSAEVRKQHDFSVVFGVVESVGGAMTFAEEFVALRAE